MHISGEKIWESVLPRLRDYIGQTWDISTITSVTKCEPETVTDWLILKQPAVGERLIKVWHLLANLGFSSPELEKLPAYNRYLGELLTFSVISNLDLLDILNLKNSQSVLHILRGQIPAAPKYDLEDLKVLFDEQLRAKKHATIKDAIPYIHERGSPPTPSTSTEVVAQQAAPQAALLIPIADITATVAALVGALVPLLKVLVSDSTTADDRSKLREIAGDEIFTGSNLLGALCSERARQQLR